MHTNGVKNYMKFIIIKKNNREQEFDETKIRNRIEKIKNKLNLWRIQTEKVVKDLMRGLSDKINSDELDHYLSTKCAERISEDPQYDKLATAISISHLHKKTDPDFFEVTKKLMNNKDKDGKRNPLLSDEYYLFVEKHKKEIQKRLDYERDYLFDYFGYKTLEKSYLYRIKIYDNFSKFKNDDKTDDKGNKIDPEKELKEMKMKGIIIERPQHLLMRVAISLNMKNIEEVFQTYELLSNKQMIFGSPTLFNAGTQYQQLSSCFLLDMDDSIEGITDVLKDSAFISKRAGGIGINISNIRAKGSLIRGTNGVSNGIVNLAKVINDLARFIDQGGRRNGAVALYIEPWHADIFDFCELKLDKGAEEMRARDIFLALWVPDLFMKRTQENGDWCLMCPDECKGLTKTYGEEFERLYLKYEKEGKYKKKIKAQELWFHILSCQCETGVPYMLYKDNVNRQSNQKNLGIIKSSNLCSEIVEFTDTNEIAVCNLGSICLPSFIETVVSDEVNSQLNNKLIKNKKKIFNFEKLKNVASIMARNLNNVIDINQYPVIKAKISNSKHRPIGIGVQGLADVFCLLEINFESEEARTLNKLIFETIYFGALEMSNILAQKYGPYETFKYGEGSPFSKGQLQFHLWGLNENDLLTKNMYDWKGLIQKIIKYGTRNSLLTTVMPTASTSQIMGFNESIEPFTTNLFTRTTAAGEFKIINKYLIEKLIERNIWTQHVKDQMVHDNGSIQKIKEIPEEIRCMFKTAFEMKTKTIMQQSIDRGPFIDQSQSLNLFFEKPSFDRLTSSHFYAWKNKLKTGLYYLRTKPAVNAIQFGLDAEKINEIVNDREKSLEEDKVCVYRRENGINCISCSG